MNTHKSNAQRLLKHYFLLVAMQSGIKMDLDNMNEIDNIVNEIILAVRDDLRQQMEDQNAGSYGEYKHRYNREDDPMLDY